MIVFLLLVIIAILLFGSSAVLGAVGAVLGSIALIIAIAVGISVAAQIPAWLWWTVGIVFGGAFLALWIAHERQQAKLRRMIDDLDPASRAAYEKIRLESEQTIRRIEQVRNNAKRR